MEGWLGANLSFGTYAIAASERGCFGGGSQLGLLRLLLLCSRRIAVEAVEAMELLVQWRSRVRSYGARQAW